MGFGKNVYIFYPDDGLLREKSPHSSTTNFVADHDHVTSSPWSLTQKCALIGKSALYLKFYPSQIIMADSNPCLQDDELYLPRSKLVNAI